MKWKLASLAASALLSAALSRGAAGRGRPDPNDIRLELSPRVCTLSSDMQNCDTIVTARWRAPRDESLCLLIVDQPQVRVCWENHARRRLHSAAHVRSGPARSAEGSGAAERARVEIDRGASRKP